MDNRRYQVIGNNYVCMALNAETVTNCVSNYLASGKKTLNQAHKDELATLLKWAAKAEIGDSLIKDTYTVSVLDSEIIREYYKNHTF